MNTDKLLADFLNPQFDLFALARQHGLTILQLLDWFDSPPTQSTLRRLDAAQACRARLAVDVEAAVKALASVAHRPLSAEASATAFETRRRAASQLLRLVLPPAAAKPAQHRHGQPAQPTPTQSTQRSTPQSEQRPAATTTATATPTSPPAAAALPHLPTATNPAHLPPRPEIVVRTASFETIDPYLAEIEARQADRALPAA